MAGPCPAVTPHHVPCLSFPISPAEIPLLLCCEGRRRATCQAAWQHLVGGGFGSGGGITEASRGTWL